MNAKEESKNQPNRTTTKIEDTLYGSRGTENKQEAFQKEPLFPASTNSPFVRPKLHTRKSPNESAITGRPKSWKKVGDVKHTDESPRQSESVGRKCPQRSDRRRISHLDRSGEAFGTRKSRHHACLKPKEILPPLQRSTFLTRKVDAKRQPISFQRRSGGDRKHDSRFAMDKSKISDRIISSCRLKFQETSQQSGNVKVSISYPPSSESKASRKVDTMKLRPLSFKGRTKTENLLTKSGTHIGSPYSTLCYNSDRSQSAKATQIGISPQSSLGSVEVETDLTENKAKVLHKLISSTPKLKCEVKGEKAIVYEKRSAKSDSKQQEVKFSDDCASSYQTIIPPIPGNKSPCSTLEELAERNAILLSSFARRPKTDYTESNIQLGLQNVAILGTILNPQSKEENKILDGDTLSNKSSYVITTKKALHDTLLNGVAVDDINSLSESRREADTVDISQDQSIQQLSRSELTEGATPLTSSEGETLYDSLNATVSCSIVSTETPRTDIDTSEDLHEDEGEPHFTAAKVNDTAGAETDSIEPFTSQPLEDETIHKESVDKLTETSTDDPRLNKNEIFNIMDDSLETRTCRLSPKLIFKSNTKRSEVARREIKKSDDNKYSFHPDFNGHKDSLHHDSKMSQSLVSKDHRSSIPDSSNSIELSASDRSHEVDSETTDRNDDKGETPQSFKKDDAFFVINQENSISNKCPEYEISGKTNCSSSHSSIVCMQDNVTKAHHTLEKSVIKESPISPGGEDTVSAISKREIVSNDVTECSIARRIDLLEVTRNVENTSAIPFKSPKFTGFKGGNSPSPERGDVSSEQIPKSPSNAVTVIEENLIDNDSIKLPLNPCESNDATGMIGAVNNTDNTEPLMERIPSGCSRHSPGRINDNHNLIVVSNANNIQVGGDITTVPKTPDLIYAKKALEPCKDMDTERYQLPGKDVVSCQWEEGERRSVITGEGIINSSDQVKTSRPSQVATNPSILKEMEKMDTEKLEDKVRKDDALVIFSDKNVSSSIKYYKMDFESCQSVEQFAKSSAVIDSPNISLRQVSTAIVTESQLPSPGINNTIQGDEDNSDALSNNHNIAELEDVAGREDVGKVERNSSTLLPIIYEETTVMSVGTDEEEMGPVGFTHCPLKGCDIAKGQAESMNGHYSQRNSGNLSQLKERFDFGNSCGALAAESFDRAYQNMCVIRMIGQLIHKKAVSILDRLYLNMENVAYSGRMTDQFYVTFLNSEEAQNLEGETEEFAERLCETFLNFHNIWTAEDAFVRCCEDMVHTISGKNASVPSKNDREQKETENGDSRDGIHFPDALP